MDDFFESEMPADVETGGNFLSAEGSYHMVVLDADPRPTDSKGNLMMAFRVHCSVLAGTVDGQKGKEIDLTFFNPKLTQKNQGEFAKKKQARFWLATGLAERDSKVIKASFADARGRHFVARLEKDENGKYLQLSYLEIYHIDDPEVASVPKDQAAIDALPPDQRRIGAKPATKPDAGNGEYSAASPAPVKQTSIDDL